MTVTQPAAFAGTTSFDTDDLLQGPVALSPPRITGTIEPGKILTASDGLWALDSDAGQPAQSWQWLRAGSNIAGATGRNYTVAVADMGAGLTVRETQSDAFGQRSAFSASVANTSAGFAPWADPALVSWYDAADAQTVAVGDVTVWSDKAGNADLTQSANARIPVSGLRTQNGLNVIDFDSPQSLETPIDLPVSGDVAIHMALIIDEADSPFSAIIAFEAVNDMQIDANSSPDFAGRLNATGIGSSVDLTGGPFAGPVIVSAVFDHSGSGTTEVFVGDTLRGSASYTTPLDASTALHVMTNRAKNAQIKGGVCELVITSDITNRADHHAYLANKWGMT